MEAVAQEVVSPNATAVEADFTDLHMIDGDIAEIIIIGVLFVVLALLVLLGGSITALWRSAPGWMNELMKPLADAALNKADAFAELTPTPIDDALLDRIRKIILEEILLMETTKSESLSAAPTIQQLDDVMFGDNKQTPPPAADPVPTGG